MQLRDSSTGTISLYDADFDFIRSKRYASIKDRNDIIEYWKKLYKLHGKRYSLVINPDINLKIT
jgi:hypothetical protein